MISKILVAVDGSASSEKAFNTAVELAKKLEVPLIILNVVEDFGDTAKVWRKHDVIVKEIEREREDLLKNYREKAEAAQLPAAIDTVRSEGNVPEQILKHAESKHASIIVIGSRGLRTGKELFVGSVSYNVVHHSTRPVLVVK